MHRVTWHITEEIESRVDKDSEKQGRKPAHVVREILGAHYKIPKERRHVDPVPEPRPGPAR